MLRMLGRSRSFTIRRRLFNGVVFPALVIGVVANAQQGSMSPQRQASKLRLHPPNPNSQLRELPPLQKHPPLARRPVQTQLPQIVVAARAPKAAPKSKQNLPRQSLLPRTRRRLSKLR